MPHSVVCDAGGVLAAAGALEGEALPVTSDRVEILRPW